MASSLAMYLGHQTSLSYHHSFRGVYVRKVPLIFTRLLLRKKLKQIQFTVRFCSDDGDQNAYGVSNSRSCSADDKGSREKNSTGQKSPISKEILENLKRFGISGILSYGLLNTAYYLSTFLLVWFYVMPAPEKMGYRAAVERFLKLMVMVWMGSQVTKLFRAACALALAPFVDRGLSWFTIKFQFHSQGKAFMAIVGFCFGLAIALFAIVTLLSA